MSPTMIWILATGLAVSILGGIAATIVVIKLPRDYFSKPKRKSRAKGLGPKLGFVAKNIAGVLLMIGGIVLLLPGIPGPGVVVLLLGLVLTDIPGKHALILKVVRKPFVMRSMNRVRKRFQRPELLTP